MDVSMFESDSPMAEAAVQLAMLEKQKKMAELLRAERMAEARQLDPGRGEMVSGHFVAPAMTQRLAALLGDYQSGQADRASQAKTAEIEALQSSALQQMQADRAKQRIAADEWRSSIPQAIAAQRGTAPPDELGGGPPTADIAAQPVTAGQILKHSLAARGNRYLKDDVDLYSKTALGELDREDRQTQATALAKAAQAARTQDKVDQRDWQTQQNYLYRRTAADQTRLIEAALAVKQQKADQSGGGGGAAKLPVSAQKHQRALLDLESGLNDYEKLLGDYDPQGKTAVSPTERKRIGAAYTDYQMRLKNAYELGAITGPDMKVLNEAVTNPVSALGTLEFGITGKEPLKAQLSEARKSLNRQRANFEVQYGMPVGDAYGGQWEENTPTPTAPKPGGPVKWGDLK